MRWNLRMAAAERGIWRSSEMRRLLADAGLEISRAKMSALWTSKPVTVRLDDIDVICAVLNCTTADLMIAEPDAVAARRPVQPEPVPAELGQGFVHVAPKLGRNRNRPPV